jgi:protoheme IX farnesyltransferase
LLSAHSGDEAARVIAAATTIAASASQRRELDDVQKSATLAELPAVYFEMGKGKLSALVTMTAAAGYLMAVPVGAPIALDMLLMTSTGTMLAAMSASAFNQVVERENDSRMTRTMRRPLVTRKISPGHAYGVASLAGIGGVALLALQVNPVTAALGAANIALYTCVYTPMKQKTHWNTWMGAVVGAIPPMMGWAAVTGNIGVGAMVMGGILFSWQMPHFLSLAYMMRKDYISGGYVMMPGEAGSPELARATVATMRHCIYLEMLCVAMPILGMADPIFVAEATVLNGGFLYLAYQFHTHGASSNQGKTNASARKLFLASLLYLPLLLACMILHRTTDSENRHCIGAHPGAIPG